MQGADGGNVERSSLFEQSLHGNAIFATYIKVVTASFARPILLVGESAELAKAVSREEYFVGAVVGDHHLGPVDHCSRIECEVVLAER